MKPKILSIGALSASMLVLSVTPIFAHAVVKPNSVGVGSFQTFTLGVPSEKPVATTGVRLVIPEGLDFVSPNVKPGWKIEIKKAAAPGGPQVADDGDVVEGRVTEIVWSGGSIPAEQRDDFMFSAKVPAKPTDLQWRVYQTYQDGTAIAWDQDPKAPQPKDSKGNNDFSKVGPYSVTKVTNDLTGTPTANAQANTAASPAPAMAKAEAGTGTYVSWAALLLSLVAFILSAKGMMKPKAPTSPMEQK